MKLVSALIFLLFATLLTSNLVWIKSVSAQTPQQGIHVYSGTPIPDNLIDGTIGDEWNDAGSYTNLSINPYGLAHIWLKHDSTNLYIALRFYADSNNPWVAFQLGPSFCMSSSADGALFGDDNYSPNGYKDIFFKDGPVTASDTIQNGVGAISVNASNLVVVELKKPLNSGDIAGNDINWTVGGTYSIVIEWNSAGLGASGGASDHSAYFSPTVRPLFIDSNTIPEFPWGTALIGFTLISITATIAAKKHSNQVHSQKSA